MKPGGKELEVWAHDPRWDVAGRRSSTASRWSGDNVYTNIFEGDGLYRVAVKPDGGAGAVTKLQTSQPLYHSDGLRAYGSDKLLMVEGETKGTLDVISLSGDNAKIEVVKGGFEGPVSLAQVGDTVYVLDVPLKYLFDPKMKGKTPPPYTASPVKVNP